MGRAARVAWLLWGLACGAPEPVNGCAPAAAADHTGDPTVIVEFAGEHGHRYAPACLRVRAGSAVVFRGPFALHPLGPGRLVDDVPEPAAANPVRDTAEGAEARFVFGEPGAYGYFCHFHTGEGMMGAVFVE